MIMHKKLAITCAAALTLFAGAASAVTVCPFRDHFYINAPLPLEVLHVATSGNLGYEQITPMNFDLGCQDNKNAGAGDVTMVIGMKGNEDLSCDISIHDGPYVMNPTINYVSCGRSGNRLFFVGMEHRPFSYDYTLKFTM
jgi:hypothetical protein